MAEKRKPMMSAEELEFLKPGKKDNGFQKPATPAASTPKPEPTPQAPPAISSIDDDLGSLEDLKAVQREPTVRFTVDLQPEDARSAANDGRQQEHQNDEAGSNGDRKCLGTVEGRLIQSMEITKSQLVAHASQLAFHDGITQKDPKAAKALGVSVALQLVQLNWLLNQNSAG